MQDLVPCVLISFAYEHILMWRGRNWKSSLPKLDNDGEEAKKSSAHDATSLALPSEGQEVSASCAPVISAKAASPETLSIGMSPMGSVDVGVEGSEDLSSMENVKPSVGADAVSNMGKTCRSETPVNVTGCSDDGPEPRKNPCESATMLGSTGFVNDKLEPMSRKCGSDEVLDNTGCTHGLQTTTMGSGINSGTVESAGSRLSAPCIEGVLLLRKQAVDNGSAIILDDDSLDGDIIYQRAVAFAKSAPPGPVFRHRPRKVAVQKLEEHVNEDLKVMDDTIVPSGRSEKKSANVKRRKDFDGLYQDVVTQGSLRVDELAKLLA